LKITLRPDRFRGANFHQSGSYLSSFIQVVMEKMLETATLAMETLEIKLVIEITEERMVTK